MNNNDLLYSNTYVSNSDTNTNINYDISPELRNTMLIDHVQNTKDYLGIEDHVLLNSDLRKTNQVLTDDGALKKLRAGALHKEQRKILAINSNQRKFFTEELLQSRSPADFKGYVSDDNYLKFEYIYNIAIGATSTVKNYDDYIKKNNVTLVQVAGSTTGARLLINNLLKDRLMASCSGTDDTIKYINEGLLDILANIVTTEQGLVSQGTIANELNVLAMTGTAYNSNNYWRPFRYTVDGVKIIMYKDQHPNNYTVILPSILTNVKSIRLLSTEIPNSINNINQRNNIIILKLRLTSCGNPPVSIDSNKSAFNFILIQLDVGIYTTEEIIKHMEDKLNITVSDLTNKKYGELFTITFNKNTGAINIKCNRKEVQFHLKFYAELADQINITNPGIPSQILGQSPGTVVNYWHDLWYMLGFPWPYEIDDTGADLYTSIYKNVINYGLHTVFNPNNNTPSDLFNRERLYVAPPATDKKPPPTLAEALDLELNLTDPKYDKLNIYRTYRYPNVGYKYIYMVLVGYKCINHINQHNNVINFTDNDIFAKVLIDNDTGKIINNSFVSNPLIFPNIIDKIELLTIQWIDEAGTLVDFNDVDHSFTLEVILYITQVESTGYNSGLGTIDTKSYPDYLNGSTHT